MILISETGAAVKPTQALPAWPVAIEKSTTVLKTGATEPSRKTERTGGSKTTRVVCTLRSFKRTLKCGVNARRAAGQRIPAAPPFARIAM